MAVSARKRVWGWMFFDWASQPFYTLGLTFIFGPYFAGVVTEMFAAQGVAEQAADARAQALWADVQFYAGLFIAFTAPILGAYADSTGRHMRWIMGFSLIYVVAVWQLWYLLPDGSGMIYTLVALGIAFIAAEFALIFTNAQLPSLGTKEEIGKVSGAGASWGYWGGVVSLFIMLLFFFETDEAAGTTLLGGSPAFGLDGLEREGTRFVGPFMAFWFVVFMAPYFLWVREPRTPKPEGSFGKAMSELGASLSGILKRPSLAAFLGSSMFYRDALNALYVFGGVYAVLVLGLGTDPSGGLWHRRRHYSRDRDLCWRRLRQTTWTKARDPNMRLGLDFRLLRDCRHDPRAALWHSAGGRVAGARHRLLHLRRSHWGRWGRALCCIPVDDGAPFRSRSSDRGLWAVCSLRQSNGLLGPWLDRAGQSSNRGPSSGHFACHSFVPDWSRSANLGAKGRRQSRMARCRTRLILGLIVALPLILASCGPAGTPGAQIREVPAANNGDTRVARFLFRAVPGASSQPAQPIGTYSRGCQAGAIELAETGPTWQAMRLSPEPQLVSARHNRLRPRTEPICGHPTRLGRALCWRPKPTTRWPNLWPCQPPVRSRHGHLDAPRERSDLVARCTRKPVLNLRTIPRRRLHQRKLDPTARGHPASGGL